LIYEEAVYCALLGNGHKSSVKLYPFLFMVMARRIACVGSSTPKGILFIMPHKYQLKKDTFASLGNVTFLIS
jgi:hypothetical protein